MNYWYGKSFMALGRVLEVLIGKPDGTKSTIREDALRISDLDMSFNIVRSNTSENNKANFTIYNAKKETRDKILQAGNNIAVYAGYEDEGTKGLIYAGTIEKAQTNTSTPDIETAISAVTYRGNGSTSATVNIGLSYEPYRTMKDVLTELATILGLNLRGAQSAAEVKLPNGFHYFGTIDGCVRKCNQVLLAQQLTIVKDNLDLFVFRLGYVFFSDETLKPIPPETLKDATGGVVYGPDSVLPQRSASLASGEESFPYLTYKGTLISVEPMKKSPTAEAARTKNSADKKHLVVTALLDPRFCPNCGIILDYQGSGPEKYVVNTVNFYGSNYDENWYAKMEVQSVD